MNEDFRAPNQLSRLLQQTKENRLPAGSAGRSSRRGNSFQRLRRRQYRSVPEPGQYRPGHAAVAFAQSSTRRALGSPPTGSPGARPPERVADGSSRAVPGRLYGPGAGRVFVDRGALAAAGRCDPSARCSLGNVERRAWQRHDERQIYPDAFSTGVKLRPFKKWQFNFDLKWNGYSGWNSSRSSSTASSTCCASPVPLSSKDATGHITSTAATDTWSWAMGVRYDVNDRLQLRAGYEIPAFGDPQGQGGHPGADRRANLYGLGLGYQWDQGHGDLMSRFSASSIHQAQSDKGRYQLQPELPGSTTWCTTSRDWTWTPR
ncbi:outer membrane protein transport protein [Pseudomonas aeruginosa]